MKYCDHRIGCFFVRLLRENLVANPLPFGSILGKCGVDQRWLPSQCTPCVRPLCRKSHPDGELAPSLRTYLTLFGVIIGQLVIEIKAADGLIDSEGIHDPLDLAGVVWKAFC